MSCLESNSGTRVLIKGKEYLYFAGTNYLSLAQSAELKAEAILALEKYGMSSSASRLTTGQYEELLLLEQELAEFFRAEAALTLAAGYLSNLAVVETLEEMVDVFICVQGAHASIQTALAQSKKPLFIARDYKEACNPQSCSHLGKNLRRAIFLEPVRALNGSVIDLKQLLGGLNNENSSGKQKAPILVLDEAQSAGVLGQRGGGALDEFGIETNANLIRTGTFSKAFGSYGGFILASKDFLNALRERSSAFKATTSLPPPITAASRAALRLIGMEPENTVLKLKSNQSCMNKLLSETGRDFLNHKSPIYYLEDLEEAPVREKLKSQGFYLASISRYFQSGDKTGLRFTIQAGHKEGELESLAECLPGINS